MCPLARCVVKDRQHSRQNFQLPFGKQVWGYKLRRLRDRLGCDDRSSLDLCSTKVLLRASTTLHNLYDYQRRLSLTIES